MSFQLALARESGEAERGGNESLIWSWRGGFASRSPTWMLSWTTTFSGEARSTLMACGRRPATAMDGCCSG